MPRRARSLLLREISPQSRTLEAVFFKLGLAFAIESLATKPSGHTEHIKDFLYELDVNPPSEFAHLPRGNGVPVVFDRILRAMRKRIKETTRKKLKEMQRQKSEARVQKILLPKFNRETPTKVKKEKYKMPKIEPKKKALHQAEQKYRFEVHPFTAAFATPPDAWLQLLADDIKAGKASPKVFKADKMVLDINTLLACVVADVEPEFVEYTGRDPLDVILDKNMPRPPLKAGQLAIAVASLLTTVQGSNQHTAIAGSSFTQKKASIRFGISVATIGRGLKIIASQNVEIVSALREGQLSVHGALVKLGLTSQKKPKPKSSLDTVIKCRGHGDRPPIAIEVSFSVEEMVKVYAAMRKLGTSDLMTFFQKVVLDAVEVTPTEITELHSLSNEHVQQQARINEINIEH